MIATASKETRMMKRNKARKLEKELREKSYDGSSFKKSDRNILNRKCSFESVEEEIEDRYETSADVIKAYKKYLPGIIKDLSEMKDPRNLKKVQHKFSLLMLYGIFMFTFHISSRRAANSDITPMFMENLKKFFPELDSLPHSCTLARLLEVVDAENIEKLIVKLVNRLIT